MKDNRYNNFHIPAGMLIVFLEKALTLIHIETHVNDEELSPCTEPFTLLSPHHCKTSVIKATDQALSVSSILNRLATSTQSSVMRQEELKQEPDVDMPDVLASSKVLNS